MLSVILYYYAQCHYADCHYADCHYAQCHYAQCHYADCHYAECLYDKCRGIFLLAKQGVLPGFLCQLAVAQTSISYRRQL